jgi:hypothetical protein
MAPAARPGLCRRSAAWSTIHPSKSTGAPCTSDQPRRRKPHVPGYGDPPSVHRVSISASRADRSTKPSTSSDSSDFTRSVRFRRDRLVFVIVVLALNMDVDNTRRRRCPLRRSQRPSKNRVGKRSCIQHRGETSSADAWLQTTRCQQLRRLARRAIPYPNPRCRATTRRRPLPSSHIHWMGPRHWVPTGDNRETLAASVISSVTALAKSENRSKQTGADERI